MQIYFSCSNTCLNKYISFSNKFLYRGTKKIFAVDKMGMRLCNDPNYYILLLLYIKSQFHKSNCFS